MGPISIAAIPYSRYPALANGRIEEVELLLATKADVNAATFRGYPALDAAAAYGHEDVVHLLIDGGANVNAADVDVKPVA